MEIFKPIPCILKNPQKICTDLEGKAIDANILNSWHHAFIGSDMNNNEDQMNEPGLIAYSSACMDYNYQTKQVKALLLEKSRKQFSKSGLTDSQLLKACNRSSRPAPPILNKMDLLMPVLELNDFTFHYELGRGSFGTVYLAQFSDDRRASIEKYYAIKVLHRSKCGAHEKEIEKSLLGEKNALGLSHPNLVRLYGVRESPRSTFVLQDYAGLSNLRDLIFDSSRDISVTLRRNLSIDLCKALEYLHDLGIVHMDLKPANVILDDKTCKLTDFGCSIRLNQDTTPSTPTKTTLDQLIDGRWTAGTWYYRAPELFRIQMDQQVRMFSNLSPACDIYSLAICMWQLLTRDSLYNNENPHVIIYQIVTKDLRPQFPQTVKSVFNKPIPLSSKPLSPVQVADSMRQSRNGSIETSLQCQTLSHSNPYKNVTLRSSTTATQSVPVDNSNFERVYRNIIEKCWNADSSQRLSAKEIKQFLSATNISYS